MTLNGTVVEYIEKYDIILLIKPFRGGNGYEEILKETPSFRKN